MLGACWETDDCIRRRTKKDQLHCNRHSRNQDWLLADGFQENCCSRRLDKTRGPWSHHRTSTPGQPSHLVNLHTWSTSTPGQPPHLANLHTWPTFTAWTHTCIAPPLVKGAVKIHIQPNTKTSCLCQEMLIYVNVNIFDTKLFHHDLK